MSVLIDYPRGAAARRRGYRYIHSQWAETEHDGMSDIDHDTSCSSEKRGVKTSESCSNSEERILDARVRDDEDD